MDAVFKVWKTNRIIYQRFFDDFSLAQLNKVPDGFSNNLIWNIGHVIVVQQSLIYKGSNLPICLSDDLVNLYKPGTKPVEPASQSLIGELKELLTAVIEQTEEDYRNGAFTTYNESQTATGFHLASVNDAFEFNNYHEALHLGFMMSIRKFV